MTGLELALLGGAIGGLSKAGTQAAATFGAAGDLRLTPEQKKRLEELQRRAAAEELGMTAAERELFRTRALTPVQGAEREAMARFGASQAVEDIGQGAAFRQQQALKETSEAARAQIKQAEIQQAALDEQRRRQELDRLQAQQQQRKALERQAALQLVGGIGETVGKGIGVYGEKKYEEELYNKRLDDMQESQKQTIEQVMNMMYPKKNNVVSQNQQSVEGASMSNVPQAMGTDGSTAGGEMVAANQAQNILKMLMQMGVFR
tara:strand:- start:6333 stop:7118 length:786 start_codon:yes stop_codon:yes gene_type:complete